MRTSVNVSVGGNLFTAEKIGSLIRSIHFLGKKFRYDKRTYVFDSTVGPWNTYRLEKAASGSKGESIPKGGLSLAATARRVMSEQAVREFIRRQNLPSGTVLMSPVEDNIKIGGREYALRVPVIFWKGFAAYVPIKK